MLKWVLLASLSFFVLSTATRAADVEGRVRLRSAKSQAKSFGYWRTWNGTVAIGKARSLPRYAAVLTGNGETNGSCQLNVRGGQLQSSTIVGRAGTRMRISNFDGTPHQIEISGLPGFSPVPIAAGNSREVQLPASGSWQIGDNFYSHIGGILVAVKDAVACAKISGNSYIFSDVPPGDYTLRFFVDGKEVSSKAVSVTTNNVSVSTVKLKAPKKENG